MTVQLIRLTAKGIAEKFWDATRSDTFRETYPTVQSYVSQCWRLWEKEAREQLTAMLASPTVSAHMKDEIYEALLKDHGRHDLHADVEDRSPLIVRPH